MHISRIPLTSQTCWDLLVAVSRLSETQQRVLLAVLQHPEDFDFTPEDHRWLQGQGLTLPQENAP